MKYPLIAVISIYQVVISPMLVLVFGHACRYKQTCSEFTKVAIAKYGMIKGLKMGIERISTCV